jgi:hypothetical protein
MEFSQPGDEIKYFRLRRVAAGVIVLGGLDDDVDDVREATATAAALFHGMIDHGGNDELPAILVQEPVDDVPDFMVGDVIATADQHAFFRLNMTSAILFIC